MEENKVSEDIIINDHDLCRRISSNIYHLRNNLKELEKSNPGILDGNDPLIQSSWEFWTTDEILEIIDSELRDVLKRSENVQSKRLQEETESE